ncbi:Myosin-binding protein 2 [Cardamine amara subsp. amara]|uniref:Myosin-binding protein 2 n=1 Tax=Cardamine amara subsp. amara TaxID=228776 RepID=A0ABD0ZFA2_CARAN
MAANRFATLIHRKTNRITLVLVYAFLEWTLIFFILLNSLFSYFILRFADYFGLKRPCLFCSRLDRFFDVSGKSPSHKDLLCDDHAFEISRVRFDSKPVEEEESNGGFGEFHKDLIEKKVSSLCAPIENDLGKNLDYYYPIGDDEGQVYNGLKFHIGKSRSIFVLEEDEKIGSVNLNDSQERKDEKTEDKVSSENTVIEIVHQSIKKIEEDEEEEEVSSDSTTDDDEEEEEEEFSCYVSSFDCNRDVATDKEEENKVDLTMEAEISPATESSESAPRNLEFYIDEEDCHLIPVEFYKPSEEVREISDINGDFILDFGAEPDFTAEEEETTGFASPDESKPEDSETNLDSSTDDLEQMQNEDEETDAEVSIGTEIPDHEQIGDVPSNQHIPHDDDIDDDHEEEDTLEFRTVMIETKRPVLNVNNEERILETQGSLESLHSLHNAMFHLDRRGSETESLDGIESSEGVLTVDKLKLELQEERKALNAVYEELEEERSASAIAANETMAMINRLHEEKAAMQMEALQYQRMMEEQAEFDQEALQLLNELMVNREKENAELEKELEVYRKRLDEYEAKEKMGMLRRRMRDSSVDSFRNNGDSDENNNGVLHCRESEMENTPVDVVLRLDECLDDYEGERLSILGRLKFLEEKLTHLNNEEDEDEGEEEEVKAFENGNGHYHGKETNGKHRVIKSKRLLPLFDAVDGEIENGLDNGNHHENGIDESEKGESVTVEEEVDELYERLEALEADREFLRHCVGSLKKGDKGVHLLNEILQHLRDLKNIDLIRVRENDGDMNF